jgi:GrpB-like predicted nucleotidyltransferase (UPF0157 family)
MSQEPTSDEDIRNYTVGDQPEPYAVKVVIDDYDSRWPRWFEDEAEKISMALGSGAVQVEHVGSTSVPGLPAKPIIDIALAVADSSQEDSFVPALVAAGYRLQIREPEWHQHRCFYTRVDKGHHRNVNLHVYTVGCSELTRYAVFRDWLRTHPEDLALYRDTKRELSTRDWKYVQNYADAKTPVIHAITTRAGVPSTPCVMY